ncbi:MAG: DUF3551 domain-containing protein [Tardiphaga sp.]
MRAALFALLALGATASFNVAPASAQTDPGPWSFNTPSGYPFCMRSLYDDDDCSYRTYAQCAATASGIGLTCFANPALAYSQGAGPQPVPRRAKRKVRSNSY